MSIALHIRLTREMDLQFRKKASITKFRTYQKKFKKIQKEIERERQINIRVKNGMSIAHAHFDLDHAENVKKLSTQKNYLLDKMKKNSDNWTGANISFPLT